MKMQPLYILSAGDARSGKLWSGTPRNLTEALEEKGVKVECLDANRILPKAARPEGAAGKTRAQLLLSAIRDIPLRRERARALTEYLMRNHEPGPLLHICPGPYLPLRRLKKDWRQYQVLDSTGNTWGRYTHFQSSRIQRVLSKHGQKRSYQTMDHLFPISCFVRDDLITYYGIDSSRVTPIGTGLGVIQPCETTKDFGNGVILTAAKERFVEKGAGLLLEAFRLAKQQNSGLQLIIVGKHELRKDIGDQDAVRVTGFLPVDELQALFEQAALFAMPATNEPWGLVYLEAMSTKTPILGLNRCAFPELSDEGRAGFAVEEATPEAVAEGILQLFSDPDQMRRMGEHGKLHLDQNYGWDKAAERMIEKIYSENR